MLDQPHGAQIIQGARDGCVTDAMHAHQFADGGKAMVGLELLVTYGPDDGLFDLPVLRSFGIGGSHSCIFLLFLSYTDLSIDTLNRTVPEKQLQPLSNLPKRRIGGAT